MEDNINIVELLKKEKPMFHLESATQDMPNVEDFFFRRGKTDTSEFVRTSYPIEDDVLNFISSNVDSHHVTLETGGGSSTVVFAAKSKKHFCVNPDATSNELVKNWLQSKGYSTDNLYFVEQSSDKGLPGLELTDKVDVALIDGNHSFPFPVIDWHFIDGYLAIGSKLLLDDTQILSVRIVKEFLLLEPSYVHMDTIGRCQIFEKVKDTRTMGWLTQERMMGWRTQEMNKKNVMWFSDREYKDSPNWLRQVLINGLKKTLPPSVHQGLRRLYRRNK